MKRFLGYLIVFVFLLIIGCAQQGAPTGGPKDEVPPVLLKAEPENYSTNFSDKKIMLTFDEFLDMGNFTQELVVSPPMDEQPEIKLRNKTLIIEFEEELKEDITYTFNFGEGIKDLNERNILMNFEYVFSTGDYLDSLSVKGTLKNAYDLTLPETPISIMLYTELIDSLPLINIPYYVGRADKEGNFAVNNLKPSIYKLFVLKDGNNNFLYDLPGEEIAFLDSSILVDAGYFKSILIESGKYDSSDFVQDTIALAIDTTGLSADTIAMLLDSLELSKPDINSIFVDLFMFVEDPVNQYLSDYNRKERRKLELLFNLPLTDSFTYAPLFPPDLRMEDFIPDFGKKRDSLTLWLADTIIAAIDTIDLKLTYTVKDSMGIDVLRQDTLLFAFREKTKKGNSRNSKEEEKKEEKKEKETIKLNTIRGNGKQNIHQKLNISLEFPIANIDSTKFNFFIIPDTTEILQDIFPAKIPLNLFTAKLDVKWQEETKYRMVLYPGAFYDIYGATHDTVDVKFTTKTITDYGKINLNVLNVQDSILIQLYKKNDLIRKKKITEPGLYVFEFMDPATYRIKFIHDRNLNGKWDTGLYMEDSQPEKVEFLPKDIGVRANWDHDVEYVMGSNDSFPVVEKKEETTKDSNRGNRNSTRTGSSTMPGQTQPNR